MSTRQKKNRGGKRRPTLKQTKFEANYIANGGNATQAAKDAGYSEKTAHEIGYENLRKPEIAARIAARVAESGVKPDEVIGTLAGHMRADLADIVPNNPILAAAKLAGVSHLVKKLTIKRYFDKSKGAEVEETEIEAHSSQAAAKQLCAVLGLNKAEQSNPYDAAREAYKELIGDKFNLAPGRAAEIVAEQFQIEASELVN